ncbi:uncharacterized protein LOC123675632 [Harmonia axyridis]|uniref:uncharacterized protein LOC123675632 n=1 Tax=Harmonia axyridis TaxID=115357 RepID=UPI001E276B4A|nr:uncharacterized protein LOC123675632 [Harmonia axyridis]
MKMRYILPEIFCLFVFVLCGDGALRLNNNSAVLAREKRGLVFPLGGTFKLVIGFGTPIKLSKTRTISVGWNFQWQYPLAVNTSVIKTYPPILSRKTREDSDVRRKEIYDALEHIFIRYNSDLQDCLVRFICEEGYSSFKHTSNGPYGELLHIILSPDDDDDGELNNKYTDARDAGVFGADCYELYPNCEEDLLLQSLFSLDFT